MSLTMHQALVPPALRSLNNFANFLKKIEQHAIDRKIDPTVFLNARLFPDMLPFTRQIQIASDGVKAAAARLSGTEVPSWPDTESSFEELQARIQKTIDYLQSFKPAQIDGSEERPIVVKLRSGDLHFTGQQYLLNFVIPNFYFHITTAYAIARSNGVELGKMDYLGRE